MSTLINYIDDVITSNRAAANTGIYKKITDKVALFKESLDKGALGLAGYQGIDRLIADRVLLLYKPKKYSLTDVKTIADPTKSIERPKVFDAIRENIVAMNGFVAWGGNDAFLCPWLSEFISPDTDGDSGNPYLPTQSFLYKEYCKDVKFNTSTTLTDQNRPIAIDFNSLLSINKEEKKLYKGYPNNNNSFKSNADAALEISLSDHITETYWCIGKTKLYDKYAVIQVIWFNSVADKNLFERPVISSSTDIKGYTAYAYLLFINLNNKNITKLSTDIEVTQSPLNMIIGYTDFIIHQKKIFCIRAISTDNVVFKGFRLVNGEKGGYLKRGNISYTLPSIKFGLGYVDLEVLHTNIQYINIKDIELPEELKTNKFGITGGKVYLTNAKLAANEANPNTFYVQLFYEMLMQFPYDSEARISGNPYFESPLGKYLRINSSELTSFCYDSDRAENITTLYGTYIVESISSIRYGGITKIIGHLYIDIPFKYDKQNKTYEYKGKNDLDIIYETIGEQSPCASPMNTNWESWTDKWIYRSGYVYPIDAFVVWHLASSSLGLGNEYSDIIVNELGVSLNEGAHPVGLEIQNIINSGATVTSQARGVSGFYLFERKWSFKLAKRAGAFSFPFERAWSYFGGNRGTGSYPISGYNASQETFLVSYTHDDVPLEGDRTDKKARPVLIIGGIGTFPDPFGTMGTWGEQYTQSPLSIEVWAFDTIEGNNLDIFSHCNSTTQPKVYMQGNEISLGTIGWYMTEYDATSPLNKTLHGMYPFAQNGIKIDSNKHKITATSYIFGDIGVSPFDPFTIYYVAFIYIQEYDETDRKYIVKNHILESRAYKIMPYKSGDYNGYCQMRLDAAKTAAYWWSKSVPARSTDPVPWFGPSQINFQISIV